jgi:hypothetical protein
MAITVATVIRNMCLSRRWQTDSISLRSSIRTLRSLTHLVAQKPDRTTAIQSVHNVFRTKVGLQNAITTEPYIEMSHMSNQRKAEFIEATFFVCEVSGEVMVNFRQEPILYRNMVHTRTFEDSILDIPRASIRRGRGQVPHGGAPPPPPRLHVSLERLLTTQNDLVRRLVENDECHGAERQQP